MKKYKLKKDLFANFKKNDIVYFKNCKEQSGYLEVYMEDGEPCLIMIKETELERYVEIQEKPKSVFDLEDGDPIYLSVYSKEFGHYVAKDEYAKHFENMRDEGFIFTTERDAEIDTLKRLAVQTIKKYIYENGLEFTPDWEKDDKYYISYSHRSKYFCVYSTVNYQIDHNLPYFKKSGDAQEIIKNFEPQLKIIFNIK